MKKRSIISLALVLILLFTATACGNSSGSGSGGSNSDPILVGVYGPMSGDSAMVGATQVEGVELAVKQINADGGINGRMIELVIEDDEQDPATAVSAVNKLIYNDNVVAIIGSVNSSCTLASMEVSMDAEVPHITPISSGASITNVGNPWIARVQASDLLQAGAAVQYAIDRLGAQRVGMIYQSDDYGTGAMEVVVQLMADEYGMTLAASEAFEASATDMSAQLLNIKEADCDAVIVWTMYQQGALIARQARQLGVDAPLVGGGGLTNAKLYELGGDAVIGIVNSQTFFANNPNASAASAKFVEDFQAEYGKIPDSNNAMAYDSMIILAEGLKYAADDLENTKIMEGILAVKDMDLATGKITMAGNGDALREEILMVRLIGDQEYELVID